jgi:hypothetical protein
MLLKKQRERKNCEKEDINMHLSFVNRRRINEDKERQLKARD